MRVLITAIRHSIDGAGGSSRFAYDEAIWLNSLGHEVWMLAPGPNPEAPEYENWNGIHFLRYLYRDRHAFDPRRLGDESLAISELLRRRGPESFDVLHGHSLLQHRAACAALEGRKHRVCFSVHSPVVDETRLASVADGMISRLKHAARSPILAKLERDALIRTDWVNAFSSFTKSRMGEFHGACADRIEITPGWADTARFRIIPDRGEAKRRLGWRTDVPVLFTLRRLVRRMGLDRLLVAVHLLRQEGLEFQLVIGGQGPLRQPLESLARQLGIADDVRFEGFVPEEELPLAYGACDAFVLPTAELECFGIIAVEALSCGRPVLATPVAAIPEIISRVEPRWLAAGADPKSIAALISEFLRGHLPLHDPAWLRRIVLECWDDDRLQSFCERALGADSSSGAIRTGIASTSLERR